MDIMPTFLTYARDFEKTLKDDDWARLHQYFGHDAIYDVEAKSFGCHLAGPDAILAGMKKSLDGFDRKFTKRLLEITSGPEISATEIRMGWKVTYEHPTLPPFVLLGRSTVRYTDDAKISYLCDAYEPSAEAEFATWKAANGVDLNPAYV